MSRYINGHISPEYVRYDDWRTFEKFLTPNGWCFKFDLKHGYHHIDLNPNIQKFFGFSWRINGITKYFIFTVLVFGLSPAPRIFTKTIRPLTTFWRAQGIKIAVYLDDGACIDNSFLIAKKYAEVVKNTLLQAGFVINPFGSPPGHSLGWGSQLTLTPTHFASVKKEYQN